MRLLEFTEDFATKVKGDKWECHDDQLASHLVNEDKVAKYIDIDQPEEVKSTKTTKKAK